MILTHTYTDTHTPQCGGIHEKGMNQGIEGGKQWNSNSIKKIKKVRHYVDYQVTMSLGWCFEQNCWSFVLAESHTSEN